MSKTQDTAEDPQSGAQPASPAADDRTIVCPGGIIDPDVTVIKVDGLVSDSNTGQETNTATPPSSSAQNAHTTTIGTENKTGSLSRSSNWGRPEQWLADDGRHIEAGVVLKDRFELIEEIGQGGMGVVYKALDRRKVEAQDRNPYLAIKILNEQFKRHPESLKALQREARKAQELAHPNIVTVFDFDREGATVFMTMEYMDGESLKDIIRKNSQGLPVAQVIPFIEGMCQGLSYAHAKGIVHSDFKPGNIFVTPTGLIKIFDFGIARATTVKNIGDTGTRDDTLFDAASLGALTPAYASPEMFLGKEPDPRDDIFALACIAYELFTGKHPYDKVRADHAQQKGMRPARLEQLNRLQWKGLSRGLEFERAARTASDLDFLKEIKSKKSKLPAIAGSSAVAVLLITLAFNKQISDGYNQYKIYSLTKKINAVADFETNEQLTTSLGNLKDLDDFNKKIFTQDDIWPVIIEKYSNRAEKLIRKNNYYNAIQLLTSARLLYVENQKAVQKLDKIIGELNTEKAKKISELREVFAGMIGAGRILPSRDGNNVFDVLEKVALIDPDNPLLTDRRLINAYVREAGISLENDDLDRAEIFIKTGLVVSESSELKELKEKFSVKLREKETKTKIVRLEDGIRDQLNSIHSLQDLEKAGVGLKKLKELSPEHDLLVQAETIGRGILDKELEAAIGSQDWKTGDDLLKRVSLLNLLGNEEIQSRSSQLTSAKEKIEGAVEVLFDKANKIIVDGNPDGALPFINEIKKLTPDDVRLQRLDAKLMQAYIQITHGAKDKHQWEAARNTLNQALSLDIDETMKSVLQKEEEDLALAEERYGQQVKMVEEQKIEQEEEQKRSKLQEEILSLHNQFDLEIQAFQPTEKSVNKALAILDIIEIKNAGDSFVNVGRTRIEELFLKESESLSKNGAVESAIKCLKIGTKALHDSQLLNGAITDYQNKLDILNMNEKEAKLTSLYGEVDKLIDSALMTKDWEVKLQKTIADISSRSGNVQDERLRSTKRKITLLYLNKARTLRDGQQFTKAYEYLDKGERFEKGNEEIVKERQLVANDEKTSKAKVMDLQRIAEIEGLKQSIRTYALANQVEQAQKTLALLKSKLSADDPFFTEEAPQVIGKAYLRLAEKKAGAKDNREALVAAIDLIKSGLAIDSTSADLLKARESYNKLIAALEQKQQEKQQPQTGQQQSLEQQQQKQALEQQQTQALAQQQKQQQTVAEQTSSHTQSPDGKLCFPNLAGLGRNNRAVCYDMLTEQDKGPYMVVIPAGGAVSKPFAIGKYEVSFKDYDLFCKASGKKSPRTSEEPGMPVIKVSYHDTQAYAQWLTEKTGNVYRIPRDDEWVYASEAGGNESVTDYNCLLQQGSIILKGNSLLGVKTGGANAWGLFNYIGNAQEYVDSSSGVMVRGGAFKNSMSVCSISLVANHSGSPDELTGFRLVREIKQ